MMVLCEYWHIQENWVCGRQL